MGFGGKVYIPPNLRARLKPQAVWMRMEQLGLSQNDLARLLGMSQGHLSMLINGQRSASQQTVEALMEILKVDEFDDLFVLVAKDAIRRKRSHAAAKSGSNGRRNGTSGSHGEQLALKGLEKMPPGTSILPDDFPVRLQLLKDATGLTFHQLGEKIGVDPRQIRRWMKGAVPGGGAMYSLTQFAMALPHGLWILYGDLSRPPADWPSPNGWKVS